MSRITVSIATVLPEPDSPTMPSTSPSAIENDTPSTARTSPLSVLKDTLRSRTSSSGSGMTDARVEQRVDEVDGRVDDDDEEGGVDDRGHDHGQVELLERLVRQPAQPVQVEHDLDEKRASADERAEVEPEEADEGDQRRTQRVPEEDAPFAQPLGVRRPDIVLLLRLDERGAQHARVETDVEDRQRQPRQQQRLEPADRRLRERDVTERRHPREEER